MLDEPRWHIDLTEASGVGLGLSNSHYRGGEAHVLPIKRKGLPDPQTGPRKDCSPTFALLYASTSRTVISDNRCRWKKGSRW
jgi:hypothetical protein